LRSFTGLNGDGASPQHGLVEVSSNNFFVGTLGGGSVALGSIQQLTFSNAPTVPSLVLATPQGPDATIACGEAVVFIAPTYSGGCAPISISSNFVMIGNTDRLTNRVTWIGTDACGQSLTNVQTIVVVDLAPPNVVTPPGPNLTINCGDPLTFAAPVYSDACSGQVTVTSNLVVLGSDCPRTNIVTWIASDPYGNSVTNSQTIVVNASAIPPPNIITQPVSVIGPSGHIATLSLVATSAPPLSYTWTFNGQALAGATNVALEVIIGPATAGAYTARAAGPGGMVDSEVVSLTLFNIEADRTLKLLGASNLLHRIEYTDSLINPETSWQTLTNVRLPVLPLIIADPAPSTNGRFYRAIMP
jgi:hypothetical protein